MPRGKETGTLWNGFQDTRSQKQIENQMDVLLFPFLQDGETLVLGMGQGEGLMSSTTDISAMHGKLQHLAM